MGRFHHRDLGGRRFLRRLGLADHGQSAGLPLGAYLWHRFLRIYPAFLICLAVVGFGFASLGAALGGGSAGLLDGLRYVAGNSLLVIAQPRVGETPIGVPYPDSWNGSLWTLFYEVLCYVMVGLIASMVSRRLVPAALVVGLVGLSLAEIAIGAGVPAPYGAHLLTMLAPFFFAGSLLFLYRDRIPLSLPLAYLLLWLGDWLPLQSVRT